MGGPREVHPPSRGFHTSFRPLYHPTPILEARKLRLASTSSASQSEAGLESVTLALELSSMRPAPARAHLPSEH